MRTTKDIKPCSYALELFEKYTCEELIQALRIDRNDAAVTDQIALALEAKISELKETIYVYIEQLEERDPPFARATGTEIVREQTQNA